jgi:hypothetical protein
MTFCGSAVRMNPFAEEAPAGAVERGIPFVFLAGYGQDSISNDFDMMRDVRKPFTVEEIQSAVRLLSP